MKFEDYVTASFALAALFGIVAMFATAPRPSQAHKPTCEEKGGKPVRPKYGDEVCIKKEVFIP